MIRSSLSCDRCGTNRTLIEGQAGTPEQLKCCRLTDAIGQKMADLCPACVTAILEQVKVPA